MTWIPQTRATTKDTQAALEQLLGLNRATFQASAFCGQGAGDRFAAASPKDRKQILADILQLGRWAQLEQHAREDRRHAEHEQAQAHARASMLEPVAGELDQRAKDVDLLEQQETTVADEVSLAEAMVAETSERHQAAQGRVAEVFQARAEQATARAAFEQLDRQRQDAADAEQQLAPARARIVELEPVAAGTPLLAAERAELDRAREQWQETRRQYDEAMLDAREHLADAARSAEAAASARQQAETLSARASALEEHPESVDRCDRCQQLLGEEGRAATIATLRAEAQEAIEDARIDDTNTAMLTEEGKRFEADANALELGPAPDAGDLEQREHDCRSAQVELASLRERAATLEERAAKNGCEIFTISFTEAQVALTAADDKLNLLLADGVPDLEELTREHRARQGRLDTERARLSETRSELAVARERVTKASEAAADLTEAREQLAAIADRLDLLRLCERAYGRDGIPMLICENAIPQIEDHANEILEQLGAGYRLELRTQRALKTGGVGDTLDVIVDTPDGARPYETFSGGERTRLNLSLRIALARLLAHRRGADSRLLVVDEPDGLDADGFERLALVLEGLRADFDTILVVSHHPDLQTAFDMVLVVERDEAGRSRIVGADREAVPA